MEEANSTQNSQNPSQIEHQNSYYLDNFWIIVDNIKNRYNDLLKKEELKILENLKNLTEDSQKLFVRIFERKGPWFRVSKISYTEIKGNIFFFF